VALPLLLTMGGLSLCRKSHKTSSRAKHSPMKMRSAFGPRNMKIIGDSRDVSMCFRMKF
jgi:hypothetical protein